MPDDVSFQLDLAGVDLTSNMKSYSLESDFLGASDYLQASFWFPATRRAKILDEILLPKSRVSFLINGLVQFRGNIDRRSIADDGTISVQASDYLSTLTDSSVDWTLRFLKGQKLEDALIKMLKANAIENIESGYNKTRNSLVGKTVYSGAPKIDSKTLTINNYKPDPGETIKQACTKLLDRHGLIMLPTLDRKTIALGQPEYRQQPTFFLNRFERGETNRNNILSGQVVEDWSRVITCVVGSGIAGDPKESRTALKVESAVWGDKAIHTIGKSTRGKRVAFGPNGNKPLFFNGKLPSGQTPGDVLYIPMYFKDNVSKSQSELDKVILKELSERLKDVLQCSYSVKGHSQNGALWSHDTIATVNDEIARIKGENLWISRRVFSMSEGTDQTTDLQLWLPDSFIL